MVCADKAGSSYLCKKVLAKRETEKHYHYSFRECDHQVRHGICKHGELDMQMSEERSNRVTGRGRHSISTSGVDRELEK